MDALAPFRIPLSALKADSASFDWELGTAFFKLFDDDHPPPTGSFSITLEIERTGLVNNLEFTIHGTLNTTCDRCMTPIQIPLERQFEVIVKPGDPASSTDEVIYINPETTGLNVGKTIYDFVLLSIPISHRIPDCESLAQPPCDMSIVQYLSRHENIPDPAEHPYGIWDELKKAIDN